MALCNYLKTIRGSGVLGYNDIVGHFGYGFAYRVPERCFCNYKPKIVPPQQGPVFVSFVSIKEAARQKFSYLKSVQKIKRLRACYYTYETMVNQLPIQEFFKEFDKEDTYFSWFIIVELHVFMVCARLMQDRDHGLVLRNEFIEAMWNDAHVRMDYLDEIVVKQGKHLEQLGSQFQAALIGYDEGVQGSDAELAAMLWRRFFGFQCDDAEKLERLVKYIRMQLDYLCSLTVSDIIYKQKISFIPLKDIKVDHLM